MSLRTAFEELPAGKLKSKDVKNLQKTISDVPKDILRINAEVFSSDDVIVVPKALFDPRYLEEGGKRLMMEELGGRDFSNDPETVVLDKNFIDGLHRDWMVYFQNFSKVTVDRKKTKGSSEPKKPTYSKTRDHYKNFFEGLELGRYNFDKLELPDRLDTDDGYFNLSKSIQDAEYINSNSPLSYLGLVKNIYGSQGELGGLPDTISETSIIKFPEGFIDDDTLEEWQNSTRAKYVKDGGKQYFVDDDEYYIIGKEAKPIPKTERFVWRNMMNLTSLFKIPKDKSGAMDFDQEEVDVNYDKFKVVSEVFIKRLFETEDREEFQRNLENGLVPSIWLDDEILPGKGAEVTYTDGTVQNFPNFKVMCKFPKSKKRK